MINVEALPAGSKGCACCEDNAPWETGEFVRVFVESLNEWKHGTILAVDSTTIRVAVSDVLGAPDAVVPRGNPPSGEYITRISKIDQDCPDPALFALSYGKNQCPPRTARLCLKHAVDLVNAMAFMIASHEDARPRVNITMRQTPREANRSAVNMRRAGAGRARRRR